MPERTLRVEFGTDVRRLLTPDNGGLAALVAKVSDDVDIGRSSVCCPFAAGTGLMSDEPPELATEIGLAAPVAITLDDTGWKCPLRSVDLMYAGFRFAGDDVRARDLSKTEAMYSLTRFSRAFDMICR